LFFPCAKDGNGKGSRQSVRGCPGLPHPLGCNARQQELQPGDHLKKKCKLRAPTVQKRVMLQVPEDIHAQLTKISKLERSSMARTCLVLLEAALKLPKYRKLLDTEPTEDNVIVEEMGLDKLSPERIKEIQVLLDALSKLKG